MKTCTVKRQMKPCCAENPRFMPSRKRREIRNTCRINAEKPVTKVEGKIELRQVLKKDIQQRNWEK
jgi:hypothetical protein